VYLAYLQLLLGYTYLDGDIIFGHKSFQNAFCTLISNPESFIGGNKKLISKVSVHDQPYYI
jgi:hypothetical protein